MMTSKQTISPGSMKYLAYSLLFSIILSGCAATATGPLYKDTPYATKSIQQEKSRIYIVRQNAGMKAQARSARIKLNDTKIGVCDIDGFFATDISPGNHIISADIPDSAGQCSVQFDAVAGKSYYFQVEPNDLNSGTLAAGMLFGVAGALVADNLENVGISCGGSFKLSLITPEKGAAMLPLMRWSAQ